MNVDSEKIAKEVGDENLEDIEMGDKEKDEGKIEQVPVAEDTMEYIKDKYRISDTNLIQGPINVNSLSPVKALKFATLAQAKDSEDLLKSHSEDIELIMLATSILVKILPTFKKDTLNLPFSKLRSMLKAIDSHFESLEKVVDVNILSQFNAMRLRTFLRIVEGDRVSLITSVKGF